MVMPYVNAGLKVRYHRVRQQPGILLGGLRNRSIDFARGIWCMQWDDHGWSDPERITRQMAERTGRGGVALRWVLVDVRGTTHGPMAFRAATDITTPGTILFRRDTGRYENVDRNEGAPFVREVRRSGLALLERDDSHLFVHCHEGATTRELETLLRRARRQPIGLGHRIRSMLTSGARHHHALLLDDRERATLAALHSHTARQPIST